MIQAALVPNFRIRETDTAVYIGPSETEIYTIPISAAYVVNASGTRYQYSTKSLTDDMMAVKTSYTSPVHSFSDWENFYLYPGENGVSAISSDEALVESTKSGFFSQAFGGGDSSVIQVAAISSAAAGTKSALVPSTFTHDNSQERYEFELQDVGGNVRLKTYDQKVAIIYNQTLPDKFAVCSQWPAPCGTTDGMFVDGWISDNPAFAINVGQYHISGGDLTKTMKVILTNTNEEWPQEEAHFQYT